MSWVSNITHCNITKQRFLSEEGLIKHMFFYWLPHPRPFKDFLIGAPQHCNNILCYNLFFCTVYV